MIDAPMILWFRRDLRLHDHPMLAAAVATGRPLIPVFVLDPETEAQGAAAKWRLGLSVAAFATALRAIGATLVLRRGAALEVLGALARETGAAEVRWSWLYDPVSKARDQAVKAGLKGQGLDVESLPGHLLHEPWTVETGGGGSYKVFTPYWRAVRLREVSACLPAPTALRGPAVDPASERLEDWHLAAGMGRGAAVAAPFQRVGEAAAQARLDAFLAGPVAGYAERRDFMAALMAAISLR